MGIAILSSQSCAEVVVTIVSKLICLFDFYYVINDGPLFIYIRIECKIVGPKDCYSRPPH